MLLAAVKRFSLIVWAWALLASLAAQAQVRLNLGLEPRANHGYSLVLWAGSANQKPARHRCGNG